MIGLVDSSDSEVWVGLGKMAPDVVVSREMRRNVSDQQGLVESDVHVLEVERLGELLHPQNGQEEEEKCEDVVSKEIIGPAGKIRNIIISRPKVSPSPW